MKKTIYPFSTFGLALWLIFSQVFAQCDPSFTFSPSANICANTLVTFTASTTSPQASFQWSFSGGATPATSTSQSVAVTFPYNNGVASTHTATLIVTDTVGGIAQTCTLSQTVNILPHTEILITDNVNFQRCVANLAAATPYTNTYVISPPASGTFTWTLGGSIPGVTSTATTQTATYTSFGSFPLTVVKQGETCPGYSGIFRYYTNPIAGLLIQGGSSFVCEGTPLTVANTSSTAAVDYYTWNWGDGTTYNTTTNATQSHTYDLTALMPPAAASCNVPAGGSFSFNVSVSAVNSCFTHFNTSPIIVGPQPRAILLPSTTSACISSGSAGVSFQNLSCPTDDDWLWTFGNGNTSTGINPFQNYTTPGTYHVTLIATDPGGCGADTAEADITIQDVPVVAAAFVGDTVACAPFTVSLTNTSVPLAGPGYTWSVSPATGWSFTGGTTAASPNPNITFSAAGTYIVSLTGSNTCGTRVWTQVFTITDVPDVVLATVPDQCAPYTANPFPLASVNLNGAPATGYTWTFTGGSPAGSTLQNPGSVTFGSSITEPTAMGISLEVSNACGTGTANTAFTATPPPGASVSYTGNGIANQNTGCQPFVVDIANIATPSTGVGFSWTVLPATGWSFVGGTSATSKSPRISFSAAGVYTVSLVAANGCSPDAVWSETFTIKDLPALTLPAIANQCGNSFSYDPATGMAVNWNNGLTQNYSWTFTGGTPATSSAVAPGMVTFAPGPCAVSLVVENECGSDTVTQTFTLSPPPTVTVGFSGNGTAGKDTGCVRLLIAVSNVAAPATGVSFSWNIAPAVGWSFVNGSSATSAAPEIEFTTHGAYTLSLTATNGCAPDATWSHDFFVQDTPSVSLPPITAPCGQLTYTANPTYAGNNAPITRYNWTFATGTPATDSVAMPGAVVFGPGNHTVTVAAENVCGITTAQQSFTVDPPITPVIDPAPDSVCINATPFTLTATPAGGTWSGPGISASTGVFSPASTTAGSKNLIYTYGTGFCLRRDTVVVVVNPLPTPDAGPDLTVCQHSPLITLGGTPAGGTWTGGVTTFNPISTGSFTLGYFYTDPITGCSRTDNRTIFVLPSPVVVMQPAPTYCVTSADITLSGYSPLNGVGGTGFWSGNGIVDAAAGTFNSSLTGAGSITLQYTFTNMFGCPDSDSVVVTVIAPATPDAGPAQDICRNIASLSLTGTPVGGTWSGTHVTSGGQFLPGAAPSGTNELVYSYGTGTCLVHDTTVVTVLDTATLSMGGQVAVCTGTPPFVLSGYTPTGGFWSGTGVTDPAIGMVDPALWPAGSPVSLTYTLVNTAGCTSAQDKSGLRRPLPVVSAGNDTSYCATLSVLNLPTPSPAGGTWSGMAGIVDASAGTLQPAVPGAGLYSAYYTFTDGFGCTNLDSAQITITALTTVLAGPDDSTCINGGLYPLTASPAGGVWSGTSVSGASFNPLTAGNGTHTLTYTYGAGVCAVADARVVTVEDSGSVDAGPLLDICATDPAFALAGASPAGGVWTGNGISNPAGTFDPALVATGSTTSLRYTVTQANGCLAADLRQVVKHALPVVTTAPDSTFCLTATLQTLNPASPTGGIWSGTGMTAGGQFDPTAGGLGTVAAVYTFADGFGCVNTDTMLLAVIAPVAIDAGQDQQLCENQGLEVLTGFFPLTGGLWSGTGISGGNPVFDPAAASTGTFTLTFETGTGSCHVVDSKQITVVPAPVVQAGPLLNACATDPLLVLANGSPAGGNWSGTGVGSNAFSAPAAGTGTFPLTYVYTDANNCTSSDTTSITVHPLPLVSFFSQPNTCRDTAALFASTGSNIATYAWTFGDGGTGNTPTLMHAFPDTGWYSIRLVGTSAAGCVDSALGQIFITDLPTPLFASDADSGCAQMLSSGVYAFPVALTDQSIPWAAPYQWDFGNGQTSSLPQPDTVWLPQGRADTTYHLTLTMTNGCGTRTYTRPITVFPLPQVDFGPNVPSGCSPLPISFANLTTGVPDLFLWDFGNGNFSADSLPPVQHYLTDSLDSTYTVRLIALNQCGSDTGYATVTVFPNTLDAFFAIDTLFGCAPLTVHVSNLTGGATNVSYDFGDGAQMAAPAGAHTFMAAGTYVVQHFADNGCSYDTARKTVEVYPSPIADFTTEAVICEGMPTDFAVQADHITGQFWDFGDLTTASDTSTRATPSYAYPAAGEYLVSLTVTSDTNGCQTLVTHPVTVTPAPVTAITPTVSAGCAPLTVAFANVSEGTFHYWEFGDSTKGVQPTPTHTFDLPGLYGVRYVTTTEQGCENDTIVPILVKETPVIDMQLSQAYSCQLPVTVDFATAATGTGLVYQWTFGDGGTAVTANPSHVYNDLDTFPVQVIVANAFLCADTANAQFTAYPQPAAVFMATPTGGCAPLLVQFTAPDSSATRWQWAFGDGDTATVQHPQHLYPAGTFDVQLIVSHEGFCPDTFSVDEYVTVNPVPIADFLYQPVVGDPSDGTVDFTNRSMFAVRYWWDFGDGDTSTLADPIHRYAVNDSLPVTLIAWNELDCPDTVVKWVKPMVFGGLQIPNAFAPGSGAGEAAWFKPVGVGLVEFEIEVYTVWGDKVWSSDKLENGRPAEAWDGTDKKGVPVNGDAFIWTVTKAKFVGNRKWEGMHYGRPGESPAWTGTVTVIR